VGNFSKRYAYVGCRTSVKRNARGKGISVYEIDGQTGKWRYVQLVEHLVNPSFLAFDREDQYLYSVHGDEKVISTFEVDRETGMLTFIGKQSTGYDYVHSGLDPTRGYNPVHVAVDPSNQYVIVANHATGKISVHPRNSNGTVGQYKTITDVNGLQYEEGEESTFSRPHQIVFDASGKYIIVPVQGRAQGNGIDQVIVYQFNADTGELIENDIVPARQRSWPRHVALHKNNHFAYVINEIDNTVTSYRFDESKGKLKPIQVIPSLPETYTGDGQASEIEVHPSGKFIYASNRIHDSIAILEVNQETGMLKHLDWVDALGQTPRFTTIDPEGKYFYVANEDSDTIVQFQIEENGKLTPTGEVIPTESPVCITFSK